MEPITLNSPIALSIVIAVVGMVSALGARWWTLSNQVSSALTREQAADIYLKQSRYYEDRLEDKVQMDKLVECIRELTAGIAELKSLLLVHEAATINKG